MKLLTYNEIDKNHWQLLIGNSFTATWFQTPEAYAFYKSVPEEMTPFCYGVSEDGCLVGIVVGYITQEKSAIKQFFTQRAIIIGGPLLADSISEGALKALLCAVKKHLRDVIYIETRNFNDYSHWRKVFEQCEFSYQPHLNFHIDTSSAEVMKKNLGKSRKRDIKTTIRDGVIPIINPTIEQVKEYYVILEKLYTTKIRTPLFSWSFFEKLYKADHAHFFLTEYMGRIIGGTTCVELKNKTVYEWFVCGEDGVYNHIFPSSYATYLGIKYAVDNNCNVFDMMGAGKPNETYGVRDFKARFGGKLVEHGRFLFVRKPLLYNIGVLAVKLLKNKQ